MARFELNIYGENDEIVKSFSTEHVRWGLLTMVLNVQDEIKDASAEEQLLAISSFIPKIFPGITADDIDNADAGDIINVFAQVGKMAGKLKAKNV